MREDLMCFRDYCLIAHYELEKDYYLESTQKHVQVLLKMNDLHEVQKKLSSFKKFKYLSNRYQKEFVKNESTFYRTRKTPMKKSFYI
jgi:hypothetical protein